MHLSAELSGQPAGQIQHMAAEVCQCSRTRLGLIHSPLPLYRELRNPVSTKLLAIEVYPSQSTAAEIVMQKTVHRIFPVVKAHHAYLIRTGSGFLFQSQCGIGRIRKRLFYQNVQSVPQSFHSKCCMLIVWHTDADGINHAEQFFGRLAYGNTGSPHPVQHVPGILGQNIINSGQDQRIIPAKTFDV